MKFVISIMLLSLLLITALVAVAYICDRLKIGTKSDTTGPVVSNNPVALYYTEQNGYEFVGSICHRCFRAIQDKAGLDCPDYVSGIYCEDLQNRVGYQQGRMVYRYEIPRKLTGLFEGGGKRIQNTSLPTDKIAAAIDVSLPAYAAPYFSYVPPVVVFDIPRNRVRIEIVNPTRNYQVQGGFQI